MTQPSPEGQRPPAEEPEVEVTVDGLALGMNPFVRKLVSSTVMGIIAALHGAESFNTIQITLRRKR